MTYSRRALHDSAAKFWKEKVRNENVRTRVVGIMMMGMIVQAR